MGIDRNSRTAQSTVFRNAILTSFVALLLFSPSIQFVAEKLAAPESDRQDVSAYLRGGTSPSDSLRHLLNFESFASGELQNALDEKIDALVPGRAYALLGNARMQNRAISLSNQLFKWSCYPTFFGSTYYFIPEQNALVRQPDTNATETLENVRIFAAGLDRIASAHKELDFTICIADLSSFSECNPARALTSKRGATTQDCVKALNEQLISENVSVIGASHSNIDEYFRHYYTTDHHWSGYGALDAFEKMTPAKRELRDSSTPSPDRRLNGLSMNGSCSRSGLELLNEPVREPFFDVSNIAITSGTTPSIVDGDNAKRILLSNPLSAEFDFYHSWYGPSQPAVLTNESALSDGRGNALLIGDSYTSAIQWLIAKTHRTTSVYLDCHGGFRGSDTLENRIHSSNCSNVYLVLAPTGFKYLNECFPNYFD